MSSLRLVEQTTAPSDAGSGKLQLYAKTDGGLYAQRGSAAESTVVRSDNIPHYVWTYGNFVQSVGYSSPGSGQFDQSTNYTDAYPPTGYTVSDNFVSAIASISVIQYAGGVNADDTMHCKWDFANSSGVVAQASADRIRVWAMNSEQRGNPYINYMIVWDK